MSNAFTFDHAPRPAPTLTVQAMGGPVRNIRLYGRLGVQFGRLHRLAVSSAAEAVRALGSQLDGFEAFLAQSKDKGVGYAVFYGRRNLEVSELRDLPDGDIRIAPMTIGGKSGGLFNIILGVVLIVVGVIVNIYAPGAGTFLIKMGVGLAVSGLVQLLTPVPKGLSARDRPDNQAGYSFNGPVNTQAQGNPVPLLYGRLIVGSAVISAGISAVDQAYIPTPNAAAGGGTGSGGGGGGGAPPWHEIFDN